MKALRTKYLIGYFYFLRSLGLAVPPRIRFLQKRQKILAAKLEKIKSEQECLVTKIEEMSEAENEFDEGETEDISEAVKKEKIDPCKTTYNFYSSTLSLILYLFCVISIVIYILRVLR